MLSLSFDSRIQIIGFLIYVVGVMIYFLSWIMQIYFTETKWSKSIFGFMAPAYSSIIWLIGIGLVGQKLLFDLSYSYAVYIIISFVFVIVHSMHAYFVFREK